MPTGWGTPANESRAMGYPIARVSYRWGTPLHEFRTMGYPILTNFVDGVPHRRICVAPLSRGRRTNCASQMGRRESPPPMIDPKSHQTTSCGTYCKYVYFSLRAAYSSPTPAALQSSSSRTPALLQPYGPTSALLQLYFSSTSALLQLYFSPRNS